MPHGIRDQYSDAPSWTVDAASGQSGKQQFGNTVFGVSVLEARVKEGPGSPGWVRMVRGKGPLTSITITAGGTGYSNSGVVTVTSVSGVNASANIVTNGSGVIGNVIVSNTGGLFYGSPNVAISGGGSGATLTPVLSGRAGRATFETIVASKNIVTDATSFSNTSTANVANSSGTSDDALFPDS